MSRNIQTKALVIKRTNYGEADRIVILITEYGQISAIAKGARKEKSKLAGGIEPFCLTSLNLIAGRGDLYTITSAKPIVFYQNIMKDFRAIQLSSELLSLVKKMSLNIDSGIFMNLCEQFLAALNNGIDMQLIEAWMLINLSQAIGEPINFSINANDKELCESKHYHWDKEIKALVEDKQGEVGCNHIKLVIFLADRSIKECARIKNFRDLMPPILAIARSLFEKYNFKIKK